MADPRLIVFDMDGPLIHSGAIIAEHMAATFTEHGLVAPTRAQSNMVIGLTLDIAMQRLADCDTDTALALAETYRRLYRAMLETEGRHEPLYAGAADALARLKAISRRKTLTLLYAAKSREMNQAQVLLGVLGSME